MKELNQLQESELGHPETKTRISQYELAFRMQLSASEVMDLTKEPQKVLDAYGAKPGAGSFANNCLLARRLVEQGVRYVQLFDWGWDFHGTNPKEDIRDGLTQKGTATAQSVAALINDLKDRGLLEATTIVWAGEFGRTPKINQGKGRDHFPNAWSTVIAGGGVKGGVASGKTSKDGTTVEERVTPAVDFLATVCSALGVDFEKQNMSNVGPPIRIVEKGAKPVAEVLA